MTDSTLKDPRTNLGYKLNVLYTSLGLTLIGTKFCGFQHLISEFRELRARINRPSSKPLLLIGSC